MVRVRRWSVDDVTYAQSTSVLATKTAEEIVDVEASVFEHFQKINYYRAP